MIGQKKIVNKRSAPLGVLLLVLTFCPSLFSQSPEAANWILGFGFGEKGAQLDFNGGSPSIRTIDVEVMNLTSSNVSMSDKEGNLLFYSNGCFIANANHDTMPNSENLTPGFTMDAQCPTGSPFNESMIVLQSSQKAQVYYLFQTINHTSYVSPSDATVLSITPFGLVYSKIDMSLDSGLGALTEKHIPILADTFSNNGFQAIKHANGIDWWLILPEYESNCYYTVLFAKDELEVPIKQCIGYEWGLIDMGNQSAVSLDGTKYARYRSTYGVTLMDFDRCTGRFENPKHFAENLVSNRVGGISFSPDGNLLYISNLLELYQFDLFAEDIEASKILIAEYDGVVNPTTTNIFLGAIGNDGKIYWCPRRKNYNLHVVNEPNRRGLACDFVHRAITLPEACDGGLPSFPNYSLGPTGSPCDISIENNGIEDCGLKDIFPYPNPTSNRVTIAGEVKAGYRFQLYDVLGKMIYSNTIDQFQETFNLPKELSSGVYVYKILGGNSCVKTEKLFLNH